MLGDDTATGSSTEMAGGLSASRDSGRYTGRDGVEEMSTENNEMNIDQLRSQIYNNFIEINEVYKNLIVMVENYVNDLQRLFYDKHKLRLKICNPFVIRDPVKALIYEQDAIGEIVDKDILYCRRGVIEVRDFGGIYTERPEFNWLINHFFTLDEVCRYGNR